MKSMLKQCALAGLLLLASAAAVAARYADVIIRGGTVYDGTGKPGRVTDIAWDEAQRRPALAVEIGCSASNPAVSESNGREFVDPDDAATNADPCVID